jgi:hypothetical protein
MDLGLGSATFVLVVQATKVGDRHDPAGGRQRDWPGNGRVLVEREMRTRFQVVRDVRGQGAAQSARIGDDDVIEALAPNGADESLGIAVLPRVERGAVRISSMPIAAAVVVHA